MNVFDAMRARRSIRSFQASPVPEAALAQMLEAAVCAPSAANRQPWRFLVVRDPAVCQRLAACVHEAVRDVAREVQPEFVCDFIEYGRRFAGLERVPALVVALARKDDTLAGLLRPDAPSRAWLLRLEQDNARMGVSMAVQNLLLAATAQGLGTCVMTGPLLARDACARILSIPEGWDILCLVCVGYPDGEPVPPRKKTAAQVTLTHPPGEAHGVYAGTDP